LYDNLLNYIENKKEEDWMICNSLESIDYYAYYAASSVLYFVGEQYD
jgi:hypothetical protein